MIPHQIFSINNFPSLHSILQLSVQTYQLSCQNYATNEKWKLGHVWIISQSLLLVDYVLCRCDKCVNEAESVRRLRPGTRGCWRWQWPGRYLRRILSMRRYIEACVTSMSWSTYITLSCWHTCRHVKYFCHTLFV